VNATKPNTVDRAEKDCEAAVPLSPEEKAAAARLCNQSATCRPKSRRLWRDLVNPSILPLIIPW